MLRLKIYQVSVCELQKNSLLKIDEHLKAEKAQMNEPIKRQSPALCLLHNYRALSFLFYFQQNKEKQYD